jgi:hypothetical protein
MNSWKSAVKSVVAATARLRFYWLHELERGQ